MKRLKLLMMLCLVAIAANASKTVYLNPGPWNADGARYAICLLSEPQKWVDFTDADGDGTYAATVDDGVKMILCRMNGATTENNWDNKWNQTSDLAAPVIDGMTFTMTSIDGAFTVTGNTAYLYNVGANKFLCSGNDWGSRAAVGAGVPVTLEIGDGIYKISTASLFEGKHLEGQWMDSGSSTNWTFEQVADNTYKVKDGDNVLVWNEGGTTVSDATDPGTTASQWKIFTEAERIAEMENATNESPMDVTFLIKNYYFAKGNGRIVAKGSDLSQSPSWKGTTLQDLWGHDAGDATACYCAEQYQRQYDNYQELTVPNGKYFMTAKGFYRGSVVPYIYANNEKCNLLPKGDDVTSLETAAIAFRDGKYLLEGVNVIVTDGHLRVGVKSDASMDWSAFDDFSLTYFGVDLTAYEEEVTTLRATLNTLINSEEKYGAGVKTAAQTTYSETESVAETKAALEEAISNLNTAISNINNSIASYAALQSAITNASNHTIYATTFETSATIYNNAITTAQAVYNAGEVADCTDAITALTNGIYAAYESDYSTFANDYAYDYSTLLSNDLTKWATSNYVVMSGTEHWNGLTGQRYYEQSGDEWNSNSWSKAASETTTLPAGKYVMSITARSSVDVTSTMSVQIGSNDPLVVTLPHKGAVGRGVTTAGVGSYAEGTYAKDNNGFGWEYRFIAFELTEESTVTISFSSSTDKRYNWVSIAAPLLKGNVHPNQIKLNQVHSLKATLEGYEGNISAETYATFADNLAAAEAATLESTNLDDIITALEANIETAKAEKAAFDRGAAMNALNTGDNSVVLTDEATRENWTPTPTNRNTWSTEADNTGMVTPFLENWKAKENGALADVTETYVPIRGLNKGYYEVSALVRIYSENGAEPTATSATFTVNGKSVSLLDGTNFEYNNMKGIYKTVSVIVSTEDALNISLAYSGANFNWIAWKNLKVTYLFETAVPVYAIAGSGSIFSGYWDAATQADILTEESEGEYSKTYSDVALDAQTIEYKVIKKEYRQATEAEAWYPEDNQTISIPVKGVYDITFTFTEEGSVVSGVATKTAEAVTISDKGWATTVTNSALNFAGSGVQAYTAKVEDNKVILKAVEDVQAETGLVLNGDEGTYYIPVFIGSSETDKGSLMFSSIYGFDIHSYYTDNYYGLTVDNNIAKFALINKPTGDDIVTIPAQKAFLAVSTSTPAHELSVVFEENETTGIDASLMNSDAKNGQVFNLNGQRVNAPAKGLYIINGKKVVKK